MDINLYKFIDKINTGKKIMGIKLIKYIYKTSKMKPALQFSYQLKKLLHLN